MIKPISTVTSIFKPAKGNALTRQVKRAKNEYIKQEVKSIANIGAVSMAMGVIVYGLNKLFNMSDDITLVSSSWWSGCAFAQTANKSKEKLDIAKDKYDKLKNSDNYQQILTRASL